MLTTDVDQTRARLQTCTTAAATVAKHAQATITTVPAIPNPPDWFVPVAADLKGAQDHAKDWLRRLCPAVSRTMPEGLASFNDAFQSATGDILDVLDSRDAGDSLTPGQRTQVESALAELITAVTARARAATALLTDVKAYFTTINGDQDQLQKDLATVSAKFTDSGKWIEQLDAVFGESFLDDDVLGPCTVIVNIKLAISAQLGQTGADPTFNTLLIAKAILENQIANFTGAQQALEDILDTWTTYKAKVDAVVSDLNDAKDDARYVAILSQLDLQTAQRQWQELADFVSGGPTNTQINTNLIQRRIMKLQLATDVKAQQEKLAGYLNAKLNVAAYVSSLQNTDLSSINFKALPADLQKKLPGDPAVLLKTVSDHLTTAKAHGQGWSNDIQPNLTFIPQAIINYNATFQEVVKVMTPLITNLSLTPLDPRAPAWRTELKALFGGLLGKITEQQTAISAEIAKLKQFNTDVTADHDNFSSGNHEFAVIRDFEQANLDALNDAITSLNSAIDQLNATITGLGVAVGASAVVMIGGVIGLAAGATGVGAVVGIVCVLAGAAGLITSAVFLDKAIKEKLADQQEKAFDEVEVTELTLQIQALDGCEKALSALVTQSQTAMESVQVILDTWATLQGKIQAVITDLDDSEKSIGDIMSLVDLDTAQDQWNQLDTFATQLQDYDAATFGNPPASANLPLSLKVVPAAQTAA